MAIKDIKVIVGLSGGVDSSVAALLLKRAGFDVHGVYLKCYWTYEGCRSDQDRNSAARVASVLDIPFEVWDFEKEYRQTVVDYFYGEYQKGRTPNPDVVCNREIKFGLFLRKALAQPDGACRSPLPFDGIVRLGRTAGAQWETHPERHPSNGDTSINQNTTDIKIFIATGHYARIGITNQEARIKGKEARGAVIFPKFSQYEKVRDSDGVKYVGIGEFLNSYSEVSGPAGRDPASREKLSLFGGVDSQKDQSYFLYAVPPTALEHVLYPLGNLTKKRVREIAKEAGLPTAERPDSTGICFIGEVNVEKFLKERIAEHEGNVVTKNGEVIGKHKGVEFYTIGQRHGFTIKPSATGPVVLPSHSTSSPPTATQLRAGAGAQWETHPERHPSQNSSLRLPYYVICKSIEKNELIVGMGEECKTQKFSVTISGNFQITIPKFQTLFVRLRNLGEFVPCEINLGFGACDLEVTLAYPVFGIAPGQSAVFYRMVENSDAVWEVAGGGVIQ